jgi:hypothetical protein
MKKRLAIILAVLLAVFACAEKGDEPIGAACEEKEDCDSSLCFQQERWGESTGWTGGYCSDECSGSCERGAECVEIGEDSYCMASCEQDSDCRNGYVCSPSVHACLPDCREGWDCGDAYVCDEDAEDGGYCFKEDGHDLGEPCDSYDECLSGYCLPDSSGWTDGMCSMESDVCPENFLATLIDGLNLCLPSCDDSGECREGYLCNPVMTVCLPDCREGWGCGETFKCGSDGFCYLPVFSKLVEPGGVQSGF